MTASTTGSNSEFSPFMDSLRGDLDNITLAGADGDGRADFVASRARGGSDRVVYWDRGSPPGLASDSTAPMSGAWPR